MLWRFTLTDYTIDASGASTVVDEPIGWEGSKIILKRDEKLHGIFFDYTLGELGFHGEGYAVIKAAYDALGIKASTDLLIEIQCADTGGYDTFYEGKLNYGKIEFIIGDSCRVQVGVEQKGCLMTFRNRWDQKVNLESLVGFDGVTALAPYDGIGTEVQLPRKDIVLASSVEMDDYEFSYVDELSRATLVLGQYFFGFEFSKVNSDDLKLNNFECFAAGEAPFSFTDNYASICPGILVPTDPILCQSQDYDIHLRLKGTITENSLDTRLYSWYVLLKWGNTTDGFNSVVLDSGSHSIGTTETINLNITHDHSYTLAAGDRLYVIFLLENYNYTSGSFVYPFTLEGSFEIGKFSARTNSLCPPSNAKVFLINETLSRTAEIITDDCMRVKSNYFGRTDSQPYDEVADGCGGLEFITNGLNIRRAKLVDGNPVELAISFKQLFEALAAIHNIGIGIEEDDQRAAGYKRLRIEPVRFFYETSLNAICDQVKELKITFDDKRVYSKVQIGYKKWEPEETGGLDDFHSKREYRTEQSSVPNTLTIESEFIASNYSMEVTRRQGVTTKDFKYDNDTFIFCYARSYSGISTDADFSPSAGDNVLAIIYFNKRITPVRNLLRWFKTISSTWSKEFTDALNLLRFTNGEANYIARWHMTDNDDCLLEDQASKLAENQDIGRATFKDADESKPLWQPEIIEFDYPLSYSQFRSIRLHPHRLVKVTQGSNEYFGWIINLEYEPNEGMARWKLVRQYSE